MLERPSIVPSIDALFRPGTVALLGVSDKPGSYGHTLEAMCRNAGFDGRVYGVNPRLAGRDEMTVARLSDLQARPDHVVISVGTAHVEKAVEQALDAGVKALSIFAQCPDRALRTRIGAAVNQAGAVLCGPNSMGLHNFHNRLRITPFDVPLDRKPGGVGLISQSGSVLGALMNNGRRFQFSQAISTGSETVTTAADYLAWMVDQPETRCIGMFLESVRDPDKFMDAMEQAAIKDIPVVITKVGRSNLGAKLAVSHTGAMVGNDDIFRTVVRRFGGHLTDSIDEMSAVLSVFSQGRPAPASGLASIHDSGGERELVADLAEQHSVQFAELSPATTTRVQDVLEDGIDPENPLDAWGTGKGAEETFRAATVAMLEDPTVGLGFYVLNWRDGYELHQMHERALTAAFAETKKPLVAVSNYSLSQSEELANRLGDLGIPVIGGLQNAILAARALLGRTSVAPRQMTAGAREHLKVARAMLDGKDWISEPDSYAVLQAYGLAVPTHRLVMDRQAAMDFASALGRPVICKTAKPSVVHKSDVAGVFPNLTDTAQVATVYEDLCARLSPQVLIAEMIPKGSEWSIGAINDPDFGPAVRIAPGGTLVELLDESVMLMAPFDPATAKNAIETLQSARLLNGYRGAPSQDMRAFAQAASDLSHLAWDLRDLIAEIEVNPIIVSQTGATVADAIIQPKQLE